MSAPRPQLSREQQVLADCQDALGYAFKRPELLRAALTHTSSANTRTASNERLEFLGDSVLGLVCCQILFENYPQFEEGDMTKIKSVVVSRKTCAKFSRELGLGDFLFLGKGINIIPDNVHADVFEATVAAIFLDGGWDVALDFVREFVEPEIAAVASDSAGNNAKSQFQTLAQKEYGELPRYVLLDEQGPDHGRCFKVAAQIDGHLYPAAWGRTKKEAEIKAAELAIAAIRESS
jgi:ribonuclease-3